MKYTRMSELSMKHDKLLNQTADDTKIRIKSETASVRERARKLNQLGHE